MKNDYPQPKIGGGAFRALPSKVQTLSSVLKDLAYDEIGLPLLFKDPHWWKLSHSAQAWLGYASFEMKA